MRIFTDYIVFLHMSVHHGSVCVLVAQLGVYPIKGFSVCCMVRPCHEFLYL